MKLSDVIKGVMILRPYYNDPDGYNMGAEHDMMFMFATDKPLPDDDVCKMHDLGWFQENVPKGCYSPEESWSAHI